jgi:hypothetical protein
MRGSHSDFGAKWNANSGVTVATAPAPRPHTTASGTQPPRAEDPVTAPQSEGQCTKPAEEHRSQELMAFRQKAQERGSKRDVGTSREDDFGCSSLSVRLLASLAPAWS